MTSTLDRPTVNVQQLGGRIGARIDGVRLGGDLTADAIATVREALLRHKVVFFRGQDHLDEAGHQAFAETFGPLTSAHPTVNTGSGRVFKVTADKGMAANAWHTDVTFVDRVPAISVLRAVHLPPYGGNTVWANTVAAYDALPAPLRALVDDLWAVHTNSYDYAQRDEESDEPDANYTRADFASQLFETEHPVVRVHPETGERSLVLGHFVKAFTGLNTAESIALFTLLQNRVTRLENTIRWTWQPGDVAVWDNRATQHYAVADFGTEYREMARITVAGDVPVSIDGRPSRVIRGNAEAYSRLDELIS
ncbi:TauD/TfdA family dioxygenase [Nocardioides cavernae]|uniref:TauD/TfdA family dioxygenase n=1 Tax=Nocardioides cavernae TaxID=1921566 RepID=A0ABR8NJP1_9ACTN|nr:TauD/TfdA family dioxygenase [Nocardioides cavernae]MBD3927435.1 TauD/TfdA family dioxygenase [Nocardioides cavernae]MBM7512960.1 taurine dioxygenase [Nocardioides cavernae]